MQIRRCMKCMHELRAEETVCPNCGREYGEVHTEPFALKPGTILDGKYLVGEMLGQGGFGITYVGFDLVLEQKVAIKEYYPMSTGMVSREAGTTVVWNGTMMAKTGTEKGFDDFLKEARKMAKLRNIPGVVGVSSVFIQNETAYIVMDYVEGETLLTKLQREGCMDFPTAVSLLTPIIKALDQVHSHGIIHRDISPDNIMVKKDGSLVLLDLGAAKDLEIKDQNGNTQHSSQLVAKHGFSPMEQYSANGNIGSWTDVYAMAASIYYCCTLHVPPAATERFADDTLSCRPLLKPAEFQVLKKAMALRQQDRIQTMGELIKALNGSLDYSEEERCKLEKIDGKAAGKKKKKKKMITAAAVLLTIVVVFAGVFAAFPSVLQHSLPIITKALGNSQRYTMMQMETPERVLATTDFWGQTKYARKDVKSVIFQSTRSDVPRDAWDVSEAGDGSIMAWMQDGNLIVAADGIICLPQSAEKLFCSFDHVKSIYFGDSVDTSHVSNMGSMFSGCSSLTSLDLSNFNTSYVTNMSNMFSGCSSLTSLNLSNFNTSHVTNMGSMFGRCSSLISLDLSGLDTSNVTNMGFMFVNCSSLTSLDLSGLDTSNVTNMNSMFSTCKKLSTFKCTDAKIQQEFQNRK